ncbi:MAG: ATP-binding protein [Betaproteobacteria bacterium]
MRVFLRRRSVRQKLLLVVLASTLAALLVLSAAMVIYDMRSYQRAGIDDLTTQAGILGRASAPALAFEDAKAARENLSSLSARTRISAAAIYTAKGTLFARYVRSDVSGIEFPAIPETDGFHVEGDQMVLFKRIVENNEILGTVYLRARYGLAQQLAEYLAILAAATLLALFVAVLLSTRMHAAVVEPIASVAGVAKQVMEKRDFSLRAVKTTEDEIGYLVDAFNDMLAEIGRRADTLEASNRTLAHEIEERRGAEEALRKSERRNRTLISAVSSIVWTADPRGRFTEEAHPWQQYTGQTQTDYAGLGWRSAFHEEDRAAIDVGWARALDSSSMLELESRLWHAPSGFYRRVSIRGVPVVEENGNVREWIGAISDIDDHRRAEDELRTLNAELERRVSARTAQLEAANKELEGFSYSVSHDLRAPLRAISGFARLLQQDHPGQLDEEGQRKLDIVINESQRMGVLIDDLLAFSRLGRQAMNLVQIDMSQLVQSTYTRLLAQHHGPAVEFRLGVLPDAMGDRSLCEQVWVNFLSNALRFTGKREHPLIEVGAISDDKEHTYFVRDNGAGFDPRYADKLFGVFQRLHTVAEFPGTGVGLALVHRIITRHHGRVWGDGKANVGATFYFTLPKQLNEA